MTAQEHNTSSQYLIILCTVKRYPCPKSASGRSFIAYLIIVSAGNSSTSEMESGPATSHSMRASHVSRTETEAMRFGPPASV